MSKTLEIATDSDQRTFEPGSTLAGDVSWSADDSPVSVELRLFYFTSGKGTQDVVLADNVVFEYPSPRERRPFSLQLPLGPCSFHGKLVSLSWALELVLNDDHTERLEIVISPTGDTLDLYAHAADNAPLKAGRGAFLQIERA